MIDINQGCENDCYWAKGHHDKQEFIDAMKDTYDLIVAEQQINYEYWRCVPSANWSEYEWCYVEATGKGRGAFEVTVVWL